MLSVKIKTLKQQETMVEDVTTSSKKLNELQPGQQGVIRSVPEHSLLAPLGLRKGKNVKILIRQPFGGPMIVKIAEREVALSLELAKKIEVAGVHNG